MQILVASVRNGLLKAECEICGVSTDTSVEPNPVETILAHLVTKHPGTLPEKLVLYLIRR